MSAPVPALARLLVRDLGGERGSRSLWVFAACLFLGIALISTSGGLLQLVRGGLDAQQRFLFGGDLELSWRAPLDDATLDWLTERGEVSRLVELRTMLGTPAGGFTVVELQSVDDAYPLYGEVRLEPAMKLAEAVSRNVDGLWGAAFDPVLASRDGLGIGDVVRIGEIELELRAEIVEQPDRSLRADVSGPPLIIDDGALRASGLAQPTSLLEYEYRLRTDEPPATFRDALLDAFAGAEWEVQTVEERSEFVTDRLDQIASVLILISFGTLFIGGLGVANSVASYLGGKLRTFATLQSIGLRARDVAFVCIGQVVLLATLSSLAGATLGAAVAWSVSRLLAARLPVPADPFSLAASTLAAIAFGVLVALVFTLPALGRTLSLRPAVLMRGTASGGERVPRAWRIATGIALLATVALLMVVVPEPIAALAFVAVCAVLMLLLDALVRLVRALARRAARSELLDGRFALRLAVTGLYRPASALRPMLLSLGIALTLLVTAATVIVSTLRAVDSTVPERAPSLVFYDIADDQLDDFRTLVEGLEGFGELNLTPLVLGRLVEVDGEPLSASGDSARALEANDEQKLSYRRAGIDDVTVTRGAWWPDGYAGPPRFAMEDREADQLGLEVGDRLRWRILGDPVDVELVAIYSQATLETSFWLEGVFTDGALEPFITRHIGSAFFAPGTEEDALASIGAAFPNVVTVSTASVLAAARATLSAASLGVALVALVSLAASVLVMSSVIAVNRQRQIREASVLHAIGTRMGAVLRSVGYEYALLGVLLTLFGAVAGGAAGYAVLRFWIELPAAGIVSTGLGVAAAVSATCLAAGALWTMRTLDARPAELLRRVA